MKTATRAGVGRGSDAIVRTRSFSSLLSQFSYASVRSRVFSLLAALLTLPASGIFAAESTDATASEGSALSPKALAPAAESVLEYRETSHSLVSWGVTFSRQSKPFLKEPPIGTRKVARGALSLSGAGREELSCIWDFHETKLYLDANGNGDLTDDEVFSTERSQNNYYSQTFAKVHLQVKTAAGPAPLSVDLHLYNPEAPRIFGTADCRSLWEGKVSLQGRDYHVGRVETGTGSIGKTNDGYLVLRPWEERETPFELHNGLLDGFGFPDNLFFAGKAYMVECAWAEHDGSPKYKLSFCEAAPELAELNVTGRSIRRVVMSPPPAEHKTKFTVVLDKPEGVVKVPVGRYAHVEVELQAGELRAYRSSDKNLEVAAQSGKTAVLTAGAPLTNSVVPARRGEQLALSYELLGADGAAYALVPQDRSHPPRFVIYKNGSQIHSGNFEFG